MNKYAFRLLLTVFLQMLVLSPAIGQASKGKKAKNKHKDKTPMEQVVMDTIEIEPFNPITQYQPTPTMHFRLLHTRLNVKPSFKEKKLYGTASLQMIPHFYPQNEVVLDAKGMDILHVRYGQSSLNYRYDGKKLNIQLPQTFTRKDTLELEISYVAKPYELDSATVKMGRGMYFINPDSTNPYKPAHLWTQGETVAASCWFPTFDVPNQKTTQEVFVTVDKSLTTFSNGLKLSETFNEDGTRTDYWKQSLPHAPYLFVLVVGPYQQYKDKLRDIEVNYYTFPKYFDDIEEVFGRTPRMMEYFSNLLGVDYPWEKYDQIILYDYTAGAMENTSASVFYELMFCNHRDLIDFEYGHDRIIAHELFHQWFGDLITCENWSQLTLNESFANYSEMLWMEELRGIDDAELHWLNGYNNYMQEVKMGKVEPIVNYFFKSPNAVFDRHRYDKGGKVLHMLRRYLGDEAFFASLQHFLTTKSFQSAEIHDLRLSFEAITGEDLNWFFNQWWLEAGHPIVNIKHAYHPEKKQISVEVVQTQMSSQLTEVPVFKLPLDIDLIFEETTIRHRVWVESAKAKFDFEVTGLPLAVNVDPGKLMLWERKDQLSTSELLTIFNRSDKILDKVFVLEQLKNRQSEPEVKAFMLQLLQHDHWYLRKAAIDAVELSAYKELPVVKSTIAQMALSDPKPGIRRDALSKIETDQKHVARQIALQLIESDSSFQVLAKALEILKDSSLSLAYKYAGRFDTFENQFITMAVATVYADTALPEHINFFERALYLQWASSFMTINEAFYKYLINADVSVFERGLTVLRNIIQNEETGRHIRAAKRTLKRLSELKITEKPIEKDALSKAKKDILEQYLSLVN